MNDKKPINTIGGVNPTDYIPTQEEVERETALCLDEVKTLVEKLQKRAVHIAGRYPQKADFVVAAQLGAILGWVRVAIGNAGANLLNVEQVAANVTGELINRRARQEAPPPVAIEKRH